MVNLAIISEVAGYGWAGSEELWLATALLAQDREWDITACLHHDLCNAEQLELFRKRGGQVVEWRRSRIARFNDIRSRIFPDFTEPRLGFPDVIMLSAGSLPSMARLTGLMKFLSKTNSPYVVLCQFNADCLPISSVERTKIKELLYRAKYTVFVSRHNQLLAERQCGFSLTNSEVVFNPIRVKCEQPLPPRSSSPVIFGCVARMELLWKGQDVLIDILRRPEWLTRSWCLNFYGDGPDRGHLEQWTAHCGLSKQVNFKGYVRCITNIWEECDLMVLPSRGEGTPLAVLESMMCGRPVVTTDVGGNREIIDDGVTGFIAEAPTVRSFAAAMERAWNARDRWEEMGVAAHRRARELAASDPAGRLLDVLCKVCAG